MCPATRLLERDPALLTSNVMAAKAISSRALRNRTTVRSAAPSASVRNLTRLVARSVCSSRIVPNLRCNGFGRPIVRFYVAVQKDRPAPTGPNLTRCGAMP